MEEDRGSVLNLFVEGTIRLDGELLARHRWVGDKIDVVDFEKVVLRVFAEVQWLGAWNRKIRIEGGDV